MAYRHNNNYSSNANNLEQRVRDALDPNLVLPIKRVRAMQRKANDYKRSYMALEESSGGDDLEYADIEKMKEKCKAHRSSLDQDYAFIKSLC